MQSVHTTAHFSEDGSVTLKAPGLAAAGDHKVLLMLEDVPSSAAESMELSYKSFARIWENPEDDIYDSCHAVA